MQMKASIKQASALSRKMRITASARDCTPVWVCAKV